MPPLISFDQDSSCDTSPSCRSKKRIDFKSDVVVQLIPNLDDYSAEEVHSCWYSADEKGQMYDEHAEIVRRMESGKRPKKNTSYRGLENWCNDNALALDELVHACIDAVMDEQDRQLDEIPRDTIDFDLFRQVSLEVTRQSANLAYKMATYDETQARKAYIAMANQEFINKQKPGRRQSLGAASVSTQTTEVSNGTMAQEIKKKHHKKNPLSHLGRKSSTESFEKPKKKKKKGTKKSSKTGKEKNTKKLGDAPVSMKKLALLREKEPLQKLMLAASWTWQTKDLSLLHQNG